MIQKRTFVSLKKSRTMESSICGSSGIKLRVKRDDQAVSICKHLLSVLYPYILVWMKYIILRLRLKILCGARMD